MHLSVGGKNQETLGNKFDRNCGDILQKVTSQRAEILFRSSVSSEVTLKISRLR